jgi:hypothetical protein
MVRNSSVTDPTREHRVRERAYHLWEADGKPHGRDVEYWERARELVGTEESTSSEKSPNAAAPPDQPRRTAAEPANGHEKLGKAAGQSTGHSEATPTPTAKRRSRPPAKRSKT